MTETTATMDIARGKKKTTRGQGGFLNNFL